MPGRVVSREMATSASPAPGVCDHAPAMATAAGIGRLSGTPYHVAVVAAAQATGLSAWQDVHAFGAPVTGVRSGRGIFMP